MNSTSSTIATARFFAIVSIVCLPLAHVFALGQFTTISFASAILAALLGLVSGVKIKPKLILITGFLPIMLLIVGLVSYALNGFGSHAENSETWKIFRGNIFLLVFACCLGVVHGLLKLEEVLKWVAVGVVCASIYGLLDVLLQQHFGVALDQYIFRYSVPENTGSLGSIIRVRSTFSEAGNFSFFLSMVAPWAMIYIQKSVRTRSYRIMLIAVIGMAFFMTISAAGYAIMLLLTFILAFRERRIVFVLPLVGALALFWYVNNSGNEIANLFLRKYTLTNSVSAVDRVNRIEYAVEKLQSEWEQENVIALLFGNGPGWVMSNFGLGLVNSYLYFAVEFGAIFLVLLIGFYWFVWRKILRGRGALVFYSFFAFVLNIGFIQDYLFLFVPFVLSLLAVIHTNPSLRHSGKSILGVVRKNNHQKNKLLRI